MGRAGVKSRREHALHLEIPANEARGQLRNARNTKPHLRNVLSFRSIGVVRVGVMSGMARSACRIHIKSTYFCGITARSLAHFLSIQAAKGRGQCKVRPSYYRNFYRPQSNGLRTGLRPIDSIEDRRILHQQSKLRMTLAAVPWHKRAKVIRAGAPHGVPTGSDPRPLPPAGNTCRDSLIAQFVADHFQPVVRALPFQVAEPLLKRNVRAKGGQLPVKHCLFTSVR